MKQLRVPTPILLAALVVAVLAVAGAFVFVPVLKSIPSGPFLTEGDRSTLEQQGSALLSLIDGYRARNGEYPESLREAGATPAQLQSKFGAWSYERVDDETPWFRLSVGDYGENRFEVHWDRVNRRWYWDT